MKKMLLATTLGLLFLPSLTVAQVSLGLRASYAIPAGDAYEHNGIGTSGSLSQSGLARRLVPVQLDASWRFSQRLSAGLYYAYGFGQSGGDLCATAAASCDSPNVFRYGVQAAFAFSNHGRADPWVGLSAGLESAWFKVKNYGLAGTVGDLNATLRGWDAAASIGVDHRMSNALVLGPVLSLNIGQYTVQHVTLADQAAVGGIQNVKTHEWLAFGVRGRFDI
jgi:outer membrane protein W